MHWTMNRWNLPTGFALVALLGAGPYAAAQTIVVDATPSHVVNTFSPPHALGGAIDRLRAGTIAQPHDEQ